MSNSWDAIRQKHPLVKRYARVSAYGVDYKIAALTDTGGVLLRKFLIVHPADIKAPRPVIVCLCGSTRFSEAFQQANLRETLAGKIVLTIGCDLRSDSDLFADQSPEALEQIKADLDALHFRKIEMADEVLILNVEGYIGESTRRELDYAKSFGKTIRYLEPVA